MLKRKGHDIVHISLFYFSLIPKRCTLLNHVHRHAFSTHTNAGLSTLRKAIQRGNIPQVQTAYHALEKSQEGLFSREILQKLFMTVRNGKRKDDIQFIKTVMNDMRAQHYRLTHFEYHALMYAYGVQGQSEKAYELLDRMQHVDNLTPNLHSYNILLGCYKRSNQLDKAKALFNEMKSRLEPDIVTYNTLFHFYLKNNEFDQLFTLYKQLKQDNITPDVYTFSTLLEAAIKSKPHQHTGLDIYNQLSTQTQHIDIHIVNAMIRFIADIDINQALDLYHDLDIKYPHLQPDTVTFNILLDICLKSNNPAKTYMIFQEMKRLSVKPDVVTFGTLIDAESKKGDIQASLDLFHDMCDASITPNDRVLNSLVNMASSKTIMSSQLDSLLKLAFRYQDKLDTKAYNALMHGLALEGRSDQAQQIYDRVFRDMSFRLPDIATFTHLLLAYVHDRKIDEALLIYQTLKQHYRKCKSGAPVKIPISLDTTFYSTLISTLSKSELEDGLTAAMTLFNDMRTLRIQPTKHIYTSMLHAAGQYRDEYVLDHVHQLIKVDLYLDPDIGIYNALMDGYNRVGDGETVLDIWQTLSEGSNILPDQTTVSIVMDSCGHNGQFYQAHSIWKSLKRSGFPLNTNNYNSYIECLCRQRGRAGWDDAYRIAEKEMFAEKEPKRDKKTINTLASFARKKGFEQSEIDEKISPFLLK